MSHELFSAPESVYSQGLLSTICVPILGTPIVYSCPIGRGFSYVNGSYVKLNTTGNAVVNGNTSDIAAQFLGITIKVEESRAVVQTQGTVTLNFDGPTVSGHAFTLSTTIAGYFHDTGSTTSSASTLGVINQTIAGVGQATAFLGAYIPSSGGGGGGTPAGSPGQIQFNLDGTNFGAFGNWDATNSLMSLGGLPITPFAGLYVGPDESTLDWPSFSILNDVSTLKVNSEISGDLSGGIPSLAFFGRIINSSTDTPQSIFGLYSELITTGPSNYTGSDAIALYGEFDHYGTGNVDNGVGVDAEAYIEADGTATTLSGLQALAGNFGGGSAQTVNAVSAGLFGPGIITNGIAVGIQSPQSGSSGITNLYGLKIADQTGATNNWAIRTDLGLVQFGDESILDPVLQGYTGADHLLVSGITASQCLAGFEAQSNGGSVTAVYGVGIISDNASYAQGVEGDAIANFDGASAVGLASFVQGGKFAVAKLAGIEVNSPVVQGSATNVYGLLIDDINAGTNRWAIKTGLGLVAFGGSPITPFQGRLYVGPDESTLPAVLQGNIGTVTALITGLNTVNSGLGVELAGTDLTGLYSVVVDLTGSYSLAVYGEAHAGSSGGDLYGLWGNIFVDPGFAADESYGLFISTPTIGAGSSLTTAYGIYIDDQTEATNNYIFKAGAGMVEIGDATKAAAVHIQGIGEFGDNTMLWLDADDSGEYSLKISNRVAGVDKFTAMYLSNNGDLVIGPNGDSGTELQFHLATNQWAFGVADAPASLQVSSWISTLRNTAPADGDVSANELADWFDPTNGAAFARFKGKTADGTVVNAGFGMNTVAAPSPSTIVLPTSVYGGSAQLLGGPTAWKSEIINGVAYKIPLY